MPSNVPLELSLAKRTTPDCVQRGTGRALCATEVTREDLVRFGGLVSVRAGRRGGRTRGQHTP